MELLVFIILALLIVRLGGIRWDGKSRRRRNIFRRTWARPSPQGIGRRGEFLVNRTVRTRLPQDEYHLIDNVTLRGRRGTNQIDHIIVSRYGVFVIETKNMSGWIFGSARDKNWTQRFRTGASYAFQNPLRQVYGDLKILVELLNIPPTAIHTLAVFTGEAEFKTPMPDNVIYGGALIRHIEARRTRLLSDEAVAGIIARLEALRLPPGDATDREHAACLRASARSR